MRKFFLYFNSVFQLYIEDMFTGGQVYIVVIQFILIFNYYLFLGSPWNFALRLSMRKLASWGYPPVKTP